MATEVQFVPDRVLKVLAKAAGPHSVESHIWRQLRDERAKDRPARALGLSRKNVKAAIVAFESGAKGPTTARTPDANTSRKLGCRTPGAKCVWRPLTVVASSNLLSAC
jgi:hypothetical protein